MKPRLNRTKSPESTAIYSGIEKRRLTLVNGINTLAVSVSHIYPDIYAHGTVTGEHEAKSQPPKTNIASSASPALAEVAVDNWTSANTSKDVVDVTGTVDEQRLLSIRQSVNDAIKDGS